MENKALLVKYQIISIFLLYLCRTVIIRRYNYAKFSVTNLFIPVAVSDIAFPVVFIILCLTI